MPRFYGKVLLDPLIKQAGGPPLFACWLYSWW